MADRRGSGVSIPLNTDKATSTTGYPSPALPSAGPPPPMQGMMGTAPVQPVFVQSPPMYMHHPMQHPGYHYGYPPPPPPMMYGSQPQLHRMRRAESINAKIYSADARRPFQHAALPPGARMPSSEFVDPDLLDPNFDNGMSEEERLLILERLKRQQDDKRDGFSERMRYWDASRGKQQDEYDEQMRRAQDSLRRSYRINKGDPGAPGALPAVVEGEAGPHPGVVIEEVIESASQHGGTAAGDNKSHKDEKDQEVTRMTSEVPLHPL